jgi:plasmid maintenance system antidote protein VapI
MKKQSALFGAGEFWLNLQGFYDLEVAKDKLLPRIEAEVRRRSA